MERAMRKRGFSSSRTSLVARRMRMMVMKWR